VDIDGGRRGRSDVHRPANRSRALASGAR
jgi:hypothetical protein